MARTASAAGIYYEGISLSFHESMSGELQPGGTAPAVATRFDIEIRIASLGRFLSDPRHAAEVTGTVSYPPLGYVLAIQSGRFQMFAANPMSGVRQLTYVLPFQTAAGTQYCLRGHKDLEDDPARCDMVDDLTRLHTTIHQGPDESGAAIATGELRFQLRDAPALALSMKLQGARNLAEELGARMAFASLVWGVLRDEYAKPFRLFYDTSYENLVLAGQLEGQAGGAREPFFFVSGVHDRGFPWGDNEMFWDVLLAIGQPGNQRMYAITDRVLAGLELDVRRGRYSYSGPLFRLRQGCATSFSAMRRRDESIEEVAARIDIEFESQAFDTVPFPFPLVPQAVRHLSSEMQKALRALLPGEHALGIQITPHRAEARTGTIELPGLCYRIQPGATAGECERGAFRNVKEPTLLYRYLCAVDPAISVPRVQITARTLRNDRTDWVKDQIDRYLGAIVARATSSEMTLGPAGMKVSPLRAESDKGGVRPFRKVGPPIVEVNNDHFPTGVFARRIVQVEDDRGERMMALEEDMSLMRLEPVRSTRKVKVSAQRGDDKLRTLDAALNTSGFEAALDAAFARSEKTRERFLIVIKPNFMFSYDKRDKSTYTDPELVAALVARIRQQGYPNVKVAEAQSTYGEFFDHRSVKEMAEYLGFEGYEVVDLTEDVDEYRDLSAALGRHPVAKTWRDADFRISFAKNKTHAYAFYSLCLKNIYGALPLSNKFKEYHCERDIYQTTIDYLRMFPVEFGIVDAWLSADGPFGVFADPGPNRTETIIAGADIVAVDWVAATKMGIDPMISKYMQLAVDVFGKPEIEFVGDANPYWPWLNVPWILPKLAHKGMDAEYRFGNLLYSIAAQMDETHFHHRNNAPHIRLLRWMTVPLRKTLFLRTGETATPLNRFFTKLFYKLGY